MAARAAMIAWPPTKEPILETIALVSFETRSLLGLIGGLLAVPIAAAILLILDEVVFPRAEQN